LYHSFAIPTHCEAMVQLACTIIGQISLDTYQNECAAVLTLQCCLATYCTPDTIMVQIDMVWLPLHIMSKPLMPLTYGYIDISWQP